MVSGLLIDGVVYSVDGVIYYGKVMFQGPIILYPRPYFSIFLFFILWNVVWRKELG